MIIISKINTQQLLADQIQNPNKIPELENQQKLQNETHEENDLKRIVTVHE